MKDAFEGLERHLEKKGGRVPPWLKREWKEEGVRFTRAQTLSQGHGRSEARECWAVSDPQLNGYIGSAGAAGSAWPHLSQIVRLKRERILKGNSTTETVYLVTSRSPRAADASRLLEYNRTYWRIENQLHWVRDVTFGEDHSQVRTRNAPQVKAALTNLTMTLLRRNGLSNIAAALRTYAARPQEALSLVLSAHLLL